MTTPLFDNAYNLDRIADALEGLLALARAHVTPAAATAAPADRDSVQQAFDAKMGDPLAALGNLSPFAELTRNVPIGIALNDAQPGEELRVKLTCAAPAAEPAPEADPFDDYTPRIRWSKYDPRSRELARLRTDAKHRAAAAKSPDQRAAALRDYRQAKSEASRRQTALRELFAEDLIDIVKGELVVYVDPFVHIKWRSEYLPAPDYILTFPK
jgi:hypothetical protein